MLVAVREFDPQLRKVCEATGGPEGGVELFHDPGGKTAARFNAKWSARAYSLDPDGRVEYVQGETTLDNEAMVKVAGLWREKEASP